MNSAAIISLQRNRIVFFRHHMIPIAVFTAILSSSTTSTALSFFVISNNYYTSIVT
jgi:Ni/Fe-hydrogenase subunit HybB-like protein